VKIMDAHRARRWQRRSLRLLPRRLPRSAGARAARLVLFGTLLVALAGCGGGGGGGRSIVLYNGQHLELTQTLVSAFEKQTGIKVQMRNDDSLVLATLLLQEGHSSPADVYISENSPELVALSQHGLLARLSPSILDQIPAADNSPAGTWVGVSLRVSSLVYNPSLLPASQLPRSILDLSQPRWKGKVAIAPTDSDFPPIVGAVIDTHGIATTRTWLAGLKRNAVDYQDEESVVSAVNRGDVACGVINQYYWYRLRLEVGASGMHSALYYFPRPDVGSITNISGIGVLASSHHLQLAERFVAFLVSKSAQEILAHSDDYEYPARAGVAANPALPPLSEVPHATLSVAALGTDAEASRLIEQTGLV
jgi:iron(III) transport system substrate-binding protein